ncbi:MAG: hypothetical protein JST47_12410 [Bacteroidetes bacterium]|nr:hypothetical protein [Bacteroidota bacterium]MBS1973962.1 hypothetical protein [Bacteroidota bacterium]
MATRLFKWLSFSLFLVTGKDGESKAPSMHPLYITVTEINHNAQDKDLEISCKIFTNDFEAALEKAYHTKVDLSDPKIKPAMDKLVGDYIPKHFRIKVDGKAVVMEFIGTEKQTDATWAYFQVNNVPSVKRLDIMNNLLYEAFDGQIGIMHVTVMGNRKSIKISNPEANAGFEF